MQTMWEKLANVIKREDLIDNELFLDNEKRVKNQNILDPIIEEFMSKYAGQKTVLIEKLKQQIEYQENVQKTLDNKLRGVREVKEILQEIQAQASTKKEKKEIILRQI